MWVRSVLALVLVLVTGCSRRTPDPNSAAPVASVVVRATDAAPEPELAVLPLPSAPPGADASEVELAASICAAAYVPSSRPPMKAVGCRSHPPFDEPQQKPDGKILEWTGDPLAFCAIQKIYRGAFTKPGVKQAIISFSQCKENDPNATWDMGFPGSAVLVEQERGRWKAVAYQAEVNTERCLQARRADARDVLLCRSNFSAGPSGTLDYFFALDFAAPKHARTLARLFSDNFDCTYGDTLPDGFVRTELTGFKLADVNKDGAVDLVVDVTRSRVGPSAALDAKVKAACAQNPHAPQPPILPAKTSTTLEFLSDVEGFTPTPATQKKLAVWKADGPEGYRGLAGVAPDPQP